MTFNKISLKRYNTFGIDVDCQEFISVESESQLPEILSKVSSRIRVLGGGSNILLTKNIPYTILHNSIKGIRVIKESEDAILVEVGGGHEWHDFVLWAVENGYGGIENLALIPGKVGAAPIQNIGAYGVEQSRCFVSLTATNITSAKEIILLYDDCKFGYRDSVFKGVFKDKFIITSVRYKLLKNNELVLEYGAIKKKLAEKRITRPNIKDVCQIVMEIRKSKLPDPKIIGNSGSFFKNPYVHQCKYLELIKDYPEMPSYPTEGDDVKIAAGWLIDQCGWKGKIIGNTGTYKHQALVLVNHGGATGEEIWNLAKEIVKDVEDKFGIILLPEVNIW